MKINIIYIIILLLFVTIIEGLIGRNNDRYLEKNKFINKINNKNIYDLGFNYIPRINNKYKYIDDVLIFIIFIVMLFFNINYINFIILYIIIRFIRMICMLSITIPPADKNCFKKQKQKQKSFKYVKFITGHCGETIFSAHTTILLLCILFIMPKVNNFFKILLFVYGLIGSILIIALRHHYTIDVILAWVITILVYISYFGKNNFMKILPNL
jgi:sphingomyelin synthase-related protein 1